jgi:hypothetical protein
MTTHKTISSLSIAAIALLAVAAPSFAQDQSGKDTQSSTSAPAVATLAANTGLRASTKTRVAPTTPKAELISAGSVAPTAKPLVLSSRTFKGQNQFTKAESSRFVNQVNFNAPAPKDPKAKKQFRGDDNSDMSGRKLITFVPSRGQKLPQ